MVFLPPFQKRGFGITYMSEATEVREQDVVEIPPIVVNDYDGNYYKQFGLDEDILKKLGAILDTDKPLHIKEGGLRYREYEEGERPPTYRLAQVGQDEVLYINSPVIEALTENFEENLGQLDFAHKKERHEFLFWEEFANAVTSGVYTWSKKKLDEQMVGSGPVDKFLKRRQLERCWKDNKSKLVNVDFGQ
jgi:hypothetical protein